MGFARTAIAAHAAIAACVLVSEWNRGQKASQADR